MFMFIVSTIIIIMSSESLNSQRLASSPYSVPIITASASDKPTLPTEPCCQGEVDHGRRQSNAITSREAAGNVSARLHQDSLIPALWPKYRAVCRKPNCFSFTGSAASLLSQVHQEGSSDEDVLSSHFKKPSSPLNYDLYPELNPDLTPDLFSIPPSPLDLSALHDTWEHVRAYCDNMVQVAIHQLIHSCLTPAEEHRSIRELMLRLGRSVSRTCYPHATSEFTPI